MSHEKVVTLDGALEILADLRRKQFALHEASEALWRAIQAGAFQPLVDLPHVQQARQAQQVLGEGQEVADRESEWERARR